MRAARALVPLFSATEVRPALWTADQTAVTVAPGVPSGHAVLDSELPGGGWPRGSLTELLLDAPGQGELTLLAPALAQLEGRNCVWVLPCTPGARRSAAEPEALPYAPALAAAGIDCARHLFVRPATARESWWAMEQALRGEHLGALIAWLPAGSSDGDFRALRRLQLLAARHQALVFVLRDTSAARAPSPAVLRLQLALREGVLQTHLLKRRGCPLPDPVPLALQPAHWRTGRVAVLPARLAARSAPAQAATAAAPEAALAQRARALVASLLGH